MQDFFARYNRLAILGLSRNPKAFSRQVYAFLAARGYDLYPVNPNLDDIDGQRCYHSLEDLPHVEAAIFFTSPRVTRDLLPACQQKGITQVWFQQGSADSPTLQAADALGIHYVDSCVFLHHPEAGFPHSMHRFFVRILGRDK